MSRSCEPDPSLELPLTRSCLRTTDDCSLSFHPLVTVHWCSPNSNILPLSLQRRKTVPVHLITLKSMHMETADKPRLHSYSVITWQPCDFQKSFVRTTFLPPLASGSYSCPPCWCPHGRGLTCRECNIQNICGTAGTLTPAESRKRGDQGLLHKTAK